jgi:hypothetical protein
MRVVLAVGAGFETGIRLLVRSPAMASRLDRHEPNRPGAGAMFKYPLRYVENDRRPTCGTCCEDL